MFCDQQSIVIKMINSPEAFLIFTHIYYLQPVCVFLASGYFFQASIFLVTIFVSIWHHWISHVSHGQNRSTDVVKRISDVLDTIVTTAAILITLDFVLNFSGNGWRWGILLIYTATVAAFRILFEFGRSVFRILLAIVGALATVCITVLFFIRVGFVTSLLDVHWIFFAIGMGFLVAALVPWALGYILRRGNPKSYYLFHGLYHMLMPQAAMYIILSSFRIQDLWF